MGTPSHIVSWWQYSRWTVNIARNSKMTEIEAGGGLWWVRILLWAIGDPSNPNARRPWLKDKFLRASVCQNSEYGFDVLHEPTHVLLHLLEVVGRDFKKIPITDQEAWGIFILMMLTSNRRYGTFPYYGSSSGSRVDIP
jgi:hypothetical protein